MDVMRGYGEGSVSFDHRGSKCKDKRHRNCSGRWYGVLYFEGQRYRVTAASRTEAWGKISDKRTELANGVVSADSYTVADAIRAFLEHGLNGRSPQTHEQARSILGAATDRFKKIKLRKLTGEDVRRELTAFAETHAQATVVRLRNYLERVVRFAESNDKVVRNVVATVETPEAKVAGRASKSLTVAQMLAVLAASIGTDMDGYIHLSCLTGIRTEEARALLWENADIDTDSPGIDVVRAARRKGEVKTRTSRRGLELPEAVADALRRHRAYQAKLRLAAGPLWEDHGLVFTDEIGRPLSSVSARTRFRRVLEKVDGIKAADWTPRELRHTFVSVLDAHDVPTAEISRLVGHAQMATTETVYRHELKVRRNAGARAMDQILTSAREG
jgi:integrase